MRATAKQREAFTARLVRELPTINVDTVTRVGRLLMRHGATYCRLQEDSCNVEMDERQQARHDKREQQVEARITQLCAEIGCGVIFQGDPRGYTVRLKLPSGYTNDWGGDGFGVVTS